MRKQSVINCWDDSSRYREVGASQICLGGIKVRISSGQGMEQEGEKNQRISRFLA